MRSGVGKACFGLEQNRTCLFGRVLFRRTRNRSGRTHTRTSDDNYAIVASPDQPRYTTHMNEERSKERKKERKKKDAFLPSLRQLRARSVGHETQSDSEGRRTGLYSV